MLAVSRPHWVCPHHRARVCFPCFHCSGSRLLCRDCLRPALGCMHFPGPRRSGSGTQVLHKGTDSVGPAFCALPRSEQLRRPGAWRVRSLRLFASSVPAAQFSGCTTSAPSQADVDRPESQEVLVSNEVCLEFGIGCLSGAMIAPFWLWLPSPACLQWGMGRSTAG